MKGDATGTTLRRTFRRGVTHLLRGTLRTAWRDRRSPADLDQIRWDGADDLGAAARALAHRAQTLTSAASGPRHVLLVGDGGALHAAVAQALRTLDVGHASAELEDVVAGTVRETPAAVVCGYADSRRMTQLAGALAHDPVLSTVPFEHVVGLDPERSMFERRDEYSSTWFVSPVLLDRPTPYAIYEESLERFEQKCGLRDYLDLYQLLADVVGRGVPGPVVEFGSYQGHSGWLLARTLAALGSDKAVHLFDVFSAFPEERLGVDHFWSGSHAVEADAVREKFADMDNVTLVAGDFEQTLPTSGLDQIALAHIDCDSYRATRYLLEAVPRRISDGGVVVCEDYGHPALLGNRAAVHDARGLDGWFRFFSQFSGCYVMVKL